MNISEIAKYGETAEYGVGESVFDEGDDGDYMYIIMSGRFGVYVTSPFGFIVKIADLSAPDFFGEMAVLDGWYRSASVVAESASKVCKVARGKVQLLLKFNADIAEKIFVALDERIAGAKKRIAALGRQSLSSSIKDGSQFSAGNKPAENYRLLCSRALELRQLNDILNTFVAVENAPVKAIDSASRPQNCPRVLPEGHPVFTDELSGNTDVSRYLTHKSGFCPVCGERFLVASPSAKTLIPVETTIDQRVKYSGFEFLYYVNTVCPTCLYTDTYHTFVNNIRRGKYAIGRLESGGSKQDFENFFANAEGFTGFRAQSRKLGEVFTSYYQSLSCLQKLYGDMGDTPQGGVTTGAHMKMAQVWQKLFWLYRDINNRLYGEICARKAFDCFDKFYNTVSVGLTPAENITVSVSCAEIMMYLGDISEAAKRYSHTMRLLSYTDLTDNLSNVKRHCELMADENYRKEIYRTSYSK